MPTEDDDHPEVTPDNLRELITANRAHYELLKTLAGRAFLAEHTQEATLRDIGQRWRTPHNTVAKWAARAAKLQEPAND